MAESINTMREHGLVHTPAFIQFLMNCEVSIRPIRNVRSCSYLRTFLSLDTSANATNRCSLALLLRVYHANTNVFRTSGTQLKFSFMSVKIVVTLIQLGS